MLLPIKDDCESTWTSVTSEKRKSITIHFEEICNLLMLFLLLNNDTYIVTKEVFTLRHHHHHIVF